MHLASVTLQYKLNLSSIIWQNRDHSIMVRNTKIYCILKKASEKCTKGFATLQKSRTQLQDFFSRYSELFTVKTVQKQSFQKHDVHRSVIPALCAMLHAQKHSLHSFSERVSELPPALLHKRTQVGNRHIELGTSQQSSTDCNLDTLLHSGS